MFATSSLISVGAQDISAGKKLIETYQWNKANQFFSDKIKENPSDPGLKFYLAETYFALGKIDSAQSNYSYVENNLKKGPEYVMSIAGQGKIILSKGDTTKAKEIFNKAIKEEKKDGDLYAYIAEACISANYPKLAEQYIARGKDITTRNAQIYLAIGDLARLRGNAGDAANAYENAYYYDKKLALAHVKVGLIYTDSRSWNVADSAFNKALEVDPNYPLAYKGLGDMYYKSGHFQEASDNYKKYFSLSEVTLDDNYRYAFILFYNQQYAEATKMIKDLLIKDSKNPVLLRLQAYISYELGVDKKGKVTDAESLKSALSNITQFFKVQKSKNLLSSDYEYLAKIEVASGLDSLAPDNYKKAFEMDSSQTSLLDDATKILVKNGKFLKATDFYKIMNKVSPDNIGINTFKMGQMYYFEALKNDTAKADSLIKRENLVLADTAFKTVATLIPTSYLGPLWMARAESQLDVQQLGMANDDYEKVIQIIQAGNEQDKRKNELFEAYNYFASLYYVKAYDALVKKNMAELQELKDKSKEYWNKMKELSPENPKADEGIKAVDALKPAPPRKQQN
jgi:tetratricopeptide (TPR) repeat protein